jgi:uncharacterized protein YaiL (DUF2058 family)
MSSSLREQLLKVGLVSEADVRRASQPPPRHSKKRPPPPSESTRSARESQATKAARDSELNRRQREKAELKARIAEMDQWVEQSRRPAIESEDYYSFIDHRRICRIAVDAPTRAGLCRGELVIVRYQRRYAIVPEATASRIRARDPERVVAQNPIGAEPPAARTDPDDPYKDFPVPDDLIW